MLDHYEYQTEEAAILEDESFIRKEHVMSIMRGVEPMGRTYAQVKIENYSDVDMVRQGMKTPTAIRSIETEALVDTGATTLCLPARMISQLGLASLRKKKVKTSRGIDEITVYSPAQLTVMERQCIVEVFELPDNVQPLLGYVPLEWLDLQIDPKAKKLIPNPEHGDEMILDLL